MCCVFRNNSSFFPPQTFPLDSVHPVYLTELPELTHVFLRDPVDHELRALVHYILDVEEVSKHHKVADIVHCQLQGL